MAITQRFAGAVDSQFPEEGDRPIMRQTFMFEGVAVHWDAAPTALEFIELKIVDSNMNQTFLVKSLDPSLDALTDWVYTIGDGPISLPNDLVAKVTFPNSAATTITIRYLGYWR